MKTLTLYNGYKLVHDRNQFGSHDWTLRDRDGDIIVAGNVAVTNKLRKLWPDDDAVDALVKTMYIGNAAAASHGWSLEVQRFCLSIGKKCRCIQLITGRYRLDDAYAEFKHAYCRRQRGRRALDRRLCFAFSDGVFEV